MKCKNCPFWKKSANQNFCQVGKCISASGKCILLLVLKEKFKHRLWKIWHSLVIKFDNLRPVKFTWKAPHHGYIGAFIMFLGYTMTGLKLYEGWNKVFVGVGLLIFMDDLIEHTIYRHTPLRIFFERVIVPFLRRTR